MSIANCGFLTYTVHGDTIWVNRHEVDGCRIQKREDGLWDVIVVYPMIETTGTLSDCLDFAENWFKESFIERFESKCYGQYLSPRYATYLYTDYLLIIQQQPDGWYCYEVLDKNTNESLFSRRGFIFHDNALNDFATWIWEMGGYTVTKNDVDNFVDFLTSEIMAKWVTPYPSRYTLDNSTAAYSAVYMTFDYPLVSAGWQLETRDEYGYTYVNPVIHAQPQDVARRIARELVFKGIEHNFDLPNLYQWMGDQNDNRVAIPA